MARTTPRYSGNESEEFWSWVNGLKGRQARGSAYMLGVILQNLEHDVLKEIARLDEMTRKK